LTTKELTDIVTANSLAIAQNTAAIAGNTKAITELTNGLHSVHASIKSLEVVAEHLLETANKHAESIAILEKEWQAYLRRMPSN
jgi:hypothetical protein